MDGSPQAPHVVVHAPEGWEQQMSQWSVSSNDSGFAFTDMSYGSDDEKFSGNSVYVCVEALTESACPATGDYLIRADEAEGFRVSISQEHRPGGEIDERTAQAWAAATVDVT
jgi:hypothetical protein